ncbi:MAG: tetratricopeptide repeat protein [Planctomycetes bacterium]|nr:tetratricopeptide repeat protein [Planctomycetota bacterium]
MSLVLLAATVVSISFAWREAAARNRESIAHARESEARQRADQEAQQIASQATAIETVRDLAEKRAKETDYVAEFQANMLRGLDVERTGRAFHTQLRDAFRTELEHKRIGVGSDTRSRGESEINEQLAVFDQLLSRVSMPDVARKVLDEALLATAAKTLETLFADQPLIQARLHGAIGSAYRAIGLLDASAIHYRKSLEIRQHEFGDENIEVTKSMNELATVLFEKGDYPTAESLCRKALEIQHRLMGAEHLEIATTLQNLATLAIQTGEVSEAEGLYKKVLAMRGKLSGTENEDYGNVMNDLAGVVYTKGDLNQAELMFRELLAIRRKQPKQLPVADTLSGLAITLGAEGKIDEAEGFLREALEIQRDQLGIDDARVAATMSILASLLKKKGDLSEVESLNRGAWTFGANRSAIATRMLPTH